VVPAVVSWRRDVVAWRLSHFLESEGGGIRVFLADCDNQEGICFL
jgi:hypothetical protein